MYFMCHSVFYNLLHADICHLNGVIHTSTTESELVKLSFNFNNFHKYAKIMQNCLQFSSEI